MCRSHALHNKGIDLWILPQHLPSAGQHSHRKESDLLVSHIDLQVIYAHTCHLSFPKRMDFVTFDFLSPFVVSKRFLRPRNVHSNVTVEISEYSGVISIAGIGRNVLQAGMWLRDYRHGGVTLEYDERSINQLHTWSTTAMASQINVGNPFAIDQYLINHPSKVTDISSTTTEQHLVDFFT